jgi:hypothetical protein
VPRSFLNILICLGLDKKDTEETESDYVVLAPDLLKIIESSILNFHLFLKMDKKKQSNVRNLFGNQNQIATPLQLIQSSLEKVTLYHSISYISVQDY